MSHLVFQKKNYLFIHRSDEKFEKSVNKCHIVEIKCVHRCSQIKKYHSITFIPTQYKLSLDKQICVGSRSNTILRCAVQSTVAGQKQTQTRT